MSVMVSRSTDRPVRWAAAAWVCGVAGVVANVVLVSFFALARPFDTDPRPSFAWLGPVNDAILVVQFLAFIPVALVVVRALPATRIVGVSTAVGVLAMFAVAVLQLLLLARVLAFDTQVVGVVAALVAVYGWLLVVSSVGHRHRSLPRTVTLTGLVVGALLPVGLLVAGSGFLLDWSTPAGRAFVVAGVVLGGLGWLGLPVWPILTARPVFGVPWTPRQEKRGEETR